MPSWTVSCHSERSEESLIICSAARQQKPEMFRFAQHDKSLNPIHGAAASNVQAMMKDQQTLDKTGNGWRLQKKGLKGL